MKKLVGKNKPFHSAVDKAAGMLKRKVGTGAEFMKELMGVTGIKPTEIQERGLNEIMGMPRMTHDQFMANLATRPAPKIREKVLGGDRNEPDSEAPYHEQYTLPGGENYREMLIKAPKQPDYMKQIETAHNELRNMPYYGRTPAQEERIGQLAKLMRDIEAKAKELPEQFPGVYHHFGGEPGILASMRLKDRTGPNGEKLLHLEELQSDWHQQGRDRGYGADWQVSQDENGKFIVLRNGRKVGGEGFDNEGMAQRALEVGQRNDEVVPDAPFKKNWEEMALKRLIHHAAEKGYHGIVVTPGTEQADRYSLAKHLDAISYLPQSENQGLFEGWKGHDRLIGENAAPQDIERYVGKELANKLLTQEQSHGKHWLRGQNLTIGGEGMKAFYDKKVPNILNSIGKKYGVKVGKTAISTPKDDPWGIEEAADFHGMTGTQYLDHPNRPQLEQQFLQDRNKHTTPVHHFPITEEMRKDVLANGLPLYAGGGEVDAEEVFMGKGGKVKEPKNTVKAYKLFRVDERHPGKLFPLFVNANQPVEMNKWVDAEVGPQTDKGKVKSKLGPLAYRPGWHSGDLPVATHIGEGGAPPTHRPRNHAWAEVEVPNDVDWQTEANKRGINKQGKLIAREAHITDQIPKGGHYRYKTNPNMTGNWLISGSMKVNKVLSHPEVERINKKAGVSDLPRKEPFNKKDFGFKYGGDVDAESYFFPNKE